MRCKACNTLLDYEEEIRVDPRTGEPVDLCNRCYTVSEESVTDAWVEYWDRHGANDDK